ncbi:HAD family hydrolase [Homoserinimonas sp. OAct 916]|uniref:HAD family hydrolase n=1 Tax=Homoserinimonas sp. OAct 916 TaxID=2211450 RepID=UPI000DBE6FCD|nr:HAD family hydrolase [Homoserinimonas sp. OAct 916]
MRTPRVVLFDLDDTLFAHRAAVDRGIADYSRRLGAPYERIEPQAASRLWYELEERHYHSYLAGDLDFEGQRRARARDFAAAAGVHLNDELAGVWFDDYFEHYVASWMLHDDALACFDALTAGIPGVRFGIITNGDRVFQSRKIERVGLTHRIERAVFSGELGITKPEAGIFHHTIGQFGVDTSDGVYIGDRLVTDALGAARAGLTGVWLNRSGQLPDPADAAEARALGVIEIHSLDELLPRLL